LKQLEPLIVDRKCCRSIRPGGRLPPNACAPSDGRLAWTGKAVAPPSMYWGPGSLLASMATKRHGDIATDLVDAIQALLQMQRQRLGENSSSI
jgi:hypothetical protein